MKKLIFLLMVLTIVGCDEFESPVMKANQAKKPVTLFAKSADGIILIDGDGNLITLNNRLVFAKVIIDSDVKAGDVIIPTIKEQP